MMPTANVETYLIYVSNKDLPKGGDGMRTTREVADWCGLSIAAARRKLWAAVETGVIEAFDASGSGTSGNAIFWRLNVRAS